jgi:hypothetical protein
MILTEPAVQVAMLIRRLKRVRTSSIAVGVLSGILLGLVVFACAWLVVSLLDMGLGLPGAILRVITVFLLVAALGVLAYRLVRIFSISHSITTYAARVGGEIKEVGLDLLAALELSRVDRRRLGYSQVLISRVIDGVTARLEGFDLEVSVRKRSALLFAALLVGIVVAGLIWVHYDAASLSYSLGRFQFFIGATDRTGIGISVEPGDDEVLAGQALSITARITGFSRRIPALHVRSGGEETAFAMEKVDSLSARGRSSFTSTLTRVDRDITYFVRLGDETTRAYRISVYEEPRIKGGTITLTYPAHTRRGSQILPQGVWDINAPYGTEAIMRLEANCSPESVRIALGDTSGILERVPVEVEGDSLYFGRVLRRDFLYWIELVARGGDEAKPHGPHTVSVSRDEAPYVRIESPETEILLEADMIIPLSVLAVDDYGISMMKLFYECPADSGAIDLAYDGMAQAQSDYDWDVGIFDLFPGDAITYYVSVADNDVLTGPKYARTEAYVARVPTVSELYTEIEDEQDQAVEDLEEIAQETRELHEQLNDLIEDMKKTPDIGWEEQQAIKQNLTDQAEIRSKLEDVASSLDQTLDRMGESSLVNFEVIQKMEEIRQLLNEVATDEMLNALEKMREAMEQLSPEEIREAMEKMSFDQEDLLRRLDQTIELLKRLRAQQRMESVLNLARELAEAQEQVNEEMRQGTDLGKTAAMEQQLLNESEALDSMMKELAEMLEEQGNPLSGEIAKAAEMLEGGIQGSMEGARQSMSSGERNKALEHGERAQGGLSQLADMLQRARDTLMGEDRKQIIEALTGAMNGLRAVSGKHEEVLRQLELPTRQTPSSELARMEMVYKEALDRIAEDLFEASKKSLFISPNLGRAVLGIGTNLESASQLLTMDKRGRAKNDVKSSLGMMNQLVTGLMDALEQSSSCSSPSGMCEAFQGLDNMCCMQMGINQGTQQFLNMGEGGLSMEQRAQMARLAAEQEAVRKGVEDLAGEFGGRNEILGRLDDLAEEARKVVDDLRRENVSPETIQRQERILTRMLNAQKSMRRRDYSQRRKSTPGEDYEVTSPPELSIEDREQLMRDLLYRKSGYYPPEYEELIRAYLRVISTRRPE